MKSGIDKDKHWYVVRTTVKGEEKAFENIRKAGYDVYFPRLRVEIQHRRTKAYVVKEQPLMPRYLFVGQPKVNPDFYHLRNCDGVEGVLGVDGRPIRVSETSVEEIYIAEIDLQFDDTKAARIHREEEVASSRENLIRRFSVSTPVRVNLLGASFSGLEGTIESISKSGKLIALVQMFSRMTIVECDPRQITIL